MSVFYVLPPRPLMGDHIARYLQSVFPGMHWSRSTRINLTEALVAAATCQPDVFVVFREDLPDGRSTAEALADGFGAEEGDEIIEIRAGGKPGELSAIHWNLPRAA